MLLQEGCGIGMTIQGSAQALIIGNTIEGNRGPGIIAVGVRALQISGNYFEANCQNLTASPATLLMNNSEGGGGVYTMNADIILGGSPETHELSSMYPSHSVIIEGGCE
jgi:parallel beta-helix repeat protein